METSNTADDTSFVRVPRPDEEASDDKSTWVMLSNDGDGRGATSPSDCAATTSSSSAPDDAAAAAPSSDSERIRVAQEAAVAAEAQRRAQREAAERKQREADAAAIEAAKADEKPLPSYIRRCDCLGALAGHHRQGCALAPQ